MSKPLATAESTAIADRTPQLIAAEIRSIDTQTRQFVLRSAVEIGNRLIEAKNLVAHGEWGKWLQDHVSYSQSTANNFMRISTEYADQSAHTFESLSYTQAISLLSLPAEEREAFVEEHDVEKMSTRELQAAIREKQELVLQLQETQQKAEEGRIAREALTASVAELETRQRAHDETVARLMAELEAAQAVKDDKAAEKVKEQLRKAKNELNEQKQRVKQLEDELKKQPIDIPKIEVPEDVQKELDTLRQREQELQTLAKLREEESAKQLADLQDKLQKNNNTAAIKVKVCFDTLLQNFNDLLASVAEVQNDEEKEKFRGAVAKLCDRMKESV